MAYIYTPAPVQSVNDQKGDVRVFEYLGEWVAGAYKKDSLVTAGYWTGVSNQDTSEDFPPVLRGAPQFAYQGDNLSETTYNTKRLLVGQRITADYAQAVHAVRIFAKAGMKYCVYGVANITNSPPFEAPLWEYTAQADGVVKAEISPPVYIKKGTAYDIYTIIQNTNALSSTTDAQYVYRTPDNPATPANAEIVHAKLDPGFLLINKTDNQGGNQSAMLAALNTGDTIRVDGFVHTVIGNEDFGSYRKIAIMPSLVHLESIYTFTFSEVTPSDIPVNIEAGYWAGTNEAGIFSETGDYDALSVTTWQYALDIELTSYNTSDHWDIISYVTASAFSARDYELPVASDTLLGGVKVGAYLAIDPSGVLDVLPPVTSVNSQTGDAVLDKSDIGLGNVDDTSDADKPVSTAQQTALDLKADIAYVDSQDAALQGNIDLKADITYVDGEIGSLQIQINQKGDITYIDSEDAALQAQIDVLPTTAYVDAGDAALQSNIDLKADITYVDSGDAALGASKADITYVDSQDALLQADIDTRAIYDTQSIKFQGEYDGRQYNPLDLATQDGWLGICNTQTTDPVAPAITGAPSFAYQGTGMSDLTENSAKIVTVQRYTMTDAVLLLGFKFFAKANTRFELFINSDPLTPGTLSTFVAAGDSTADQEVEVKLASSVIVNADKTFDIIAYIEDLSPPQTTVTASYNYTTPQNAGTPASGVAEHSNKALSNILFNKTDNNATDRSSLLALMVSGSTITFDNFTFTVVSNTDSGAYHDIEVSPPIQQAGGIKSMDFTYSTSSQIDYRGESGYWASNPNVASAYDPNGNYQDAVNGVWANYQYPIDIEIQGITLSPNWDILATSSAGSSNGGGGGAPYILPVATDSTLGGVKSSASIQVDGGTGVATVDTTFTDARYYTQAAADAAFATAAQGALADSATQPGDDISTLNNDAGYLDGTTGYTQAAADAAFLSSNINDYPTMT